MIGDVGKQQAPVPRLQRRELRPGLWLTEPTTQPSNARWLQQIRLPTELDVRVAVLPARIDVVVALRDATATVILDLSTRERVAHAAGTTPDRFLAGLFAARIAGARNDLDHGQARTQTKPPFVVHDPRSWTAMQLTAAVTGATWMPPAGWFEPGPYGRALQRRLQRQFNALIRR